MTTTVTEDPRSVPGAGRVRPLCWSAVALEGFDLVVLGVVLPVLRRDPAWNLDPASGSLVATVGLLGVMVGALAVGPVADVVGRRATTIGTVTVFSVLTLACAFAPNAEVLGALRFLAGLGLGGVLPVALVAEYAPTGRGSSATTTMMTGYHGGAVLTALLGIVLRRTPRGERGAPSRHTAERGCPSLTGRGPGGGRSRTPRAGCRR